MKCKIQWDCQSVIILLYLSLFLISSYALINIPGPLEWALIDVLNIDTYSYGILVSLCSWASLLDVVHGYLLDRYMGVKLATWIYSGLVIIGCALYSVGGFSQSYYLMLSGRIVFGLGVNPLVLLANKHIIHWFGKGKYVNFVYSFCESIFWLGASVIFLVTTPILTGIQQYVSAKKAFGITNAAEVVFFMVLTVVPMIVIAYMYRKGEDSSVKPNTPSHHEKTESTDEIEEKEKDTKTFRDYVCFPIVFWVFSISIFLYYVSILSFISMSILFFQTNYGISPNKASTLSGLISLLPAVGSPFCGLILDKIGHNLTSFTTAILLNALSLGLLTWSKLDPIFPVIIMGLSLITSSGLWSQFQFLVEEHQYMIAYGVAQTGLNGAQAVGTMIAGAIIDSHGYTGFMIFQFAVIVCAVPLITIVWFYDYQRDHFMNMTSKEKNIILGRIKPGSSGVNAENQAEI